MKAGRAETHGTGEELHCLVLQLSRTGDVLQSLLALKAVKRLYPYVRFSVVARGEFADPFRKVGWIDSVYILDTASILAEASVSHSSARTALTEFVRPIAEREWDFVVDWTFSETSSWLSSLIPAKDRLGYARGSDLALRCADAWAQYVQAVLQGGCPQNIHVTDVLATQLLTVFQIRLGDPQPTGDEAVTGKDFFGETEPSAFASWMSPSLRWISIQLGASRDENAWLPGAWARLATRILEKHPDARIVLLGKKEDIPREKAFFSALGERESIGNRVQSLVGRTDFTAWTSVIGRSHWFFAAKTSAVHLAGLLGTRVMQIHPGDKTWRESGPYGNGHLILIPSDAKLGLRSIDPESVYASWSYCAGSSLLQRNVTLRDHFRKTGASAFFANSRLYQARIRDADAGGGVVYEAKSPYALTRDEWLASVHGHIARAWYCGWTPPLEAEFPREAVSPDLVRELRELRSTARELARLAEEGKRLSMELRELGQKLKSDRLMRIEDRNLAHERGRSVLERGEKIEKIAADRPEFTAFARMLRVMMHNLEGSRLHEMGYESALNFKQLEEGFRLLTDWADHTLSLTKLVSVGAGAAPAKGVDP